ncbi:hypothetical protein HK099_004515 [Clydaea vesicula]|uniref:NADH dehydrogenase [ubiquinone] 1 alpha subcomplex subunit 13 n=1 Tax=Clydaea vesicula TaxID=447962 RepID=A0AAD5U6Z3_9FUNG|nr:hypothetical protein HK099_004515 [Clydaea vesicula]KAJ3392898.1 hypothetical protein HDU92_008120 [Lobulomyces angularis]
MPSYSQDLPPEGGFPTSIRYQRYIPKRGPSGFTLFVASFAIMGYGWYWVLESNNERRELSREKAWARIHLVPLLQAETDRDIVRRLEAAKKREQVIIDNQAPTVKEQRNFQALDLKAKTPGVGRYGGYDPKQAQPVYHTDRYVAPTFLLLPKEKIMNSQWWRGSKLFLKNPAYHERDDFSSKLEEKNF